MHRLEKADCAMRFFFIDKVTGRVPANVVFCSKRVKDVETFLADQHRAATETVPLESKTAVALARASNEKEISHGNR